MLGPAQPLTHLLFIGCHSTLLCECHRRNIKQDQHLTNFRAIGKLLPYGPLEFPLPCHLKSVCLEACDLPPISGIILARWCHPKQYWIVDLTSAISTLRQAIRNECPHSLPFEPGSL